MTLVRKLLHDDRGERISGMLMDDSKKKKPKQTLGKYFIYVFFCTAGDTGWTGV